MGQIVIACYRPKAGKEAALDALCRTHFLRLYELGLVTRRRPIVMRAGDGTLLEVFEWKSQRAIDSAHENPAVLQMWGEYAEVCEYVPVATLPEASELFSGFHSVDFEVVQPKLGRVFNHVQVDARIGTSGALTEQSLADIAAAGYRSVINLLPDDNAHALPNEAALAAKHGITYAHIPVDFAAPTDEDFAAFAKTMAAAAGDKTWVHCAANMRVTAFMSAYGIAHLGWTPERAQELASEVWQPDPVWQTFLERNGIRLG